MWVELQTGGAGRKGVQAAPGQRPWEDTPSLSQSYLDMSWPLQASWGSLGACTDTSTTNHKSLESKTLTHSASNRLS